MVGYNAAKSQPSGREPGLGLEEHNTGATSYLGNLDACGLVWDAFGDALHSTDGTPDLVRARSPMFFQTRQSIFDEFINGSAEVGCLREHTNHGRSPILA